MPRKLLLTGITTGVLLTATVWTSSASAAITFQWKVGGSLLKSGENKELTANAVDGFELKGVDGGLNVLLLSNTFLLVSGARIEGGQPGKSKETIEFDNVKIDRPGGCGVSQNGIAEHIKTAPIRSEIVESAGNGKGTGEALILFVPESSPTNTTFATFEFTGTSCLLKGQVPSFTGSVLPLPLPQVSEALDGLLDIEAAAKEYKNSKGETAKVGIVLANSSAALNGVSLAVLNTDQAYGAF
jgi:hypothetical protein